MIKKATGNEYVSCLVNLYEDENDHVPWHSDNEKEVGPSVASISLGATRTFKMRRMDSKRPDIAAPF